jgi:hypothetical protein
LLFLAASCESVEVGFNGTENQQGRVRIDADLEHFKNDVSSFGSRMAFEAGSFDFNTGMAGHLGSPVVTAAHSAMFGIIYLTYTSFPFAIATASTIR